MNSFSEKFIVEPELLRVETAGAYAFDNLFDFIVRIKQAAQLSGRDRILVDSSELTGTITEAERFQGGQYIAEVFGGRSMLAWVLPKDQITKLGELAAVNRGAKFLVTSSVSEAKEWLLR